MASASTLLEEDKVCSRTKDPRHGIWCVFGQCTGSCTTCFKRCEKGVCYRRLINDTHNWGLADDMGNGRGKPLHHEDYVNKSSLDWVRYCKCDDGYIGSSCEITIMPAFPVVYTLLGLVGTTLLSIHFLGGMDHFLGRGEEHEIIDNMDDFTTSKIVEGSANCIAQHLMMSSGAFAYSVPWTHDFFLIVSLRETTQLVMSIFKTLTAWITPDDWTSRDAFMIQMLAAAVLPILLLATAYTSRARPVNADGTPGSRKKEFTGVGSFICFGVLPLLTIPTVNVLFKPVVGCHLQLPSWNPQPIAPEDMTRSNLMPEESFLPVMQRTDCAYGNATWNYFIVGAGLLLPFWMFGLYLGTQLDETKTEFPMRKGYHVMHTQLMVLCAISYRAFKQHHPKTMCICLTLFNSLELALVMYWNPHNRRHLNDMRHIAAVLAVIWCFNGLLACFVGDETNYTSAILLFVCVVAWAGYVFWLRLQRTGTEQSDAESALSPREQVIVAEAADDEAPVVVQGTALELEMTSSASTASIAEEPNSLVLAPNPLADEETAGDEEAAAGLAALEAELGLMKLGALKRRARESGVEDQLLEDADEADDPKAVVGALIVDRWLADHSAVEEQ